MLGRVLVFAVFAMVAPAAAAPFPDEGDAFLMSVRQPAGPGREAFGRWEGTPRPRGGGWTLTVTCGLVDTRTGRETIMYRGRGDATVTSRGRSLAAIRPVPDVSSAQTSGVEWSGNPGAGTADVATRGPAPCPSGTADVSSGD